MKPKITIFLGAMLVLVAAALVVMLNRNQVVAPSINTYDDCVNAGYPVAESFPPQCMTPDGRSFTGPGEAQEPNKESELLVRFSNDPDSNDDFTYTVEVTRQFNGQDAAQAALTELISGPTESERASGLFTPIKLSGASNCGGDDFTLTQDELSIKVQFCRAVQSAGIGDDARIISVIEQTLAANSAVEPKAIIIDQNGDCFGDMSGQNACLSD